MPRAMARATLAIFCSLALSSGGCALHSEIVALDGSHRLMATDGASGISVVVTTEAWEGSRWLEQDLSVVHVLVSNLGSEPVRLAPGDFVLEDRRGFRYPLYDTGARFRREGTPDRHYPRGGDYPVRGILDGELARDALPWGVLLPGTQMRGFVYFDDFESTANEGELRWRAHTQEGRPIADFRFPVAVARSRKAS